jgi:polysaccharide pyruvyl transferase WcaK-like protein
MIILIFASVGFSNLGDELILKNEIELLRIQHIEKNPKFLVFSYDHKNPFYKKDYIEYKPYFPINIRKINNIILNIKNFFLFLYFLMKSDLIVIGWGWLFFDNEVWNKKNPLDLWLFRRRIFNLFLKKVSFFRVWIDIKNNDNLKKIEKLFKNSSNVSVRDNNSYELLKGLWIESVIENDPVFFDRWKEVLKKSLIWKISSTNFDISKLEKFDFENKKIWIAFRSWYLVENWLMSDRLEEWKLREIINYIVISGWEIVLLPHSFHDTDVLSNDYIFLKRFLWNNVTIKNSVLEVYNTYKNKEIDICFSMRLHSVILSHVYEIPFVWVSYSKKTDEILEILKNY